MKKEHTRRKSGENRWEEVEKIPKSVKERQIKKKPAGVKPGSTASEQEGKRKKGRTGQQARQQTEQQVRQRSGQQAGQRTGRKTEQQVRQQTGKQGRRRRAKAEEPVGIKRNRTGDLPKVKSTVKGILTGKSKLDLKRAGRIMEFAVELAAVCALAFVLVLFYGQRVSNAGDSMSPVLQNGDVVLVDRLIYNAVAPKRGDVIVFKPAGNKNSHYLIKRIAALPGETVQIKDGEVYIDGKKCTEDIYAKEIADAGIAAEALELGENEYFVLGDNHAGSDDSRMADVGNVQRRDIFGKAWFVASFGENFGFLKKNE